MKTSIDLPDELYRQVKARSALEGKTVREVATSLFAAYAAGEAGGRSAAGAQPNALESYRRHLAALRRTLGEAGVEGGIVDQLLRDRR